MRYWLMKSEPSECSIDDLVNAPKHLVPWVGVRNYQARNFMRQMQPGDGVLIYHSSTAIPGVAGIAEVASEPYPDPTQFQKKSDYYDPKSTREEPRWSLVDVAFVRKLPRVIALEEIKAIAEQLDGFALLQRGSRLSVLPVSASQWKAILSLE
jgi:predicted RNA-binding protein with PUA-like domain